MRLVLISSILWVTSHSMKKPDLYAWLEQNSYLCDLSIFGNSMPHFLPAEESRQFACDCGDPLISRAACARRGNEMPHCHEIPDLCMREYAILFTETGDRLAQPLTTRATTTTTEPPTTTTQFSTSTRLPSRRQQPFFRTFQRQPGTTRRPTRREFVFRNRVFDERNAGQLRRQKTFSLQDRFPATRRPLRSRQRPQPLPRLLPSSRFRPSQRIQKQPTSGRLLTNFADNRLNRGRRRLPTAITPSLTSTTASTTTTTTTTTPTTTTTTTPTTTTTTATTTTTVPSTTTTPTTTTTAATTTKTTTTTTPGPTTTTVTTTATTTEPTTTTARSTSTTTTLQPTTTTALTTLRTTTNIAEVIKMSKTEMLIAELTSRLRAIGHEEPEHPLRELQELLRRKIKPTTTTTTNEPTTTTTTKTPGVVDEEVRNESKSTLAGKNAKAKQVQQVETTIRETPPEESTTQVAPEKPVPVKPSAADVEVKSKEKEHEQRADKEMKKTEKGKFSSKIIERRDNLILDDSIHVQRSGALQFATSSGEAAEGASEKKKSQPKKSMPLLGHQEEAIEFLKRKVEQLELRLMDTFARRAQPTPAAKESSNPDDLIASDEEVVNIRRQSRLDSRRHNSNADLTDGDNFLKSLDDIAQILTDAMPKEQDGDKEESVKQLVEGSGKEKPEPEITGSGNEKSEQETTVVFTTTEKAPYTSVELLTHEPDSSTPRSKACVDSHELCPTWRSGQLCLTSPMFMYKFCRKSCGICGDWL